MKISNLKKYKKLYAIAGLSLGMMLTGCSQTENQEIASTNPISNMKEVEPEPSKIVFDRDELHASGKDFIYYFDVSETKNGIYDKSEIVISYDNLSSVNGDKQYYLNKIEFVDFKEGDESLPINYIRQGDLWLEVEKQSGYVELFNIDGKFLFEYSVTNKEEQLENYYSLSLLKGNVDEHGNKYELLSIEKIRRYIPQNEETSYIIETDSGLHEVSFEPREFTNESHHSK